MKYKLLNDDKQKTYAIILDSGEEAKEQLLAFAKKMKLSASQFTAIGAFSQTTVGFFDFSIKDYKKTEFNEQLEVLSLTGDISLFNGEYKVHAHITLAREDGTAYGGHLIKGIVHPTLEIILNESPLYLKREIDKESGIPLIKI
ncbi:MAG TPA: PPC domain-containing DNA-binding protein [Hanamia sp.]|nr:PPC domain-containing DNA-binding protein [Hanamia sp.]